MEVTDRRTLRAAPRCWATRCEVEGAAAARCPAVVLTAGRERVADRAGRHPASEGVG
jgi:hypothetical protein